MKPRRAIQLLVLAALIAAALLWRAHPAILEGRPATDAGLVNSVLDLVERQYISEVDETRMFVWAAEAIADGVRSLNNETINETPSPEAGPDAAGGPGGPKPEATPKEPQIAEAIVEPGERPARVELRVRDAVTRLDFSGDRDENVGRLLAAIDFAANNGGISDRRELLYHVLSGMLLRLDPHSAFLDPDEVRKFRDDTSGSFGGVGIEIGLRDRMLTVISPIDGTPAKEAGIQSGDLIRAIDGATTDDMSLFDAVDRIRGPEGTGVTLTIEREGREGTFDVPMVRARIKVEAVKPLMLDRGIGYLRITQFNVKTADELYAALKTLTSGPRPLSGLIIDLRNNPGGLLDAAIEVSDAFIDDGLIVSTRGRAADTSKTYEAARRGTLSDVPIVVLTNFGSASASEIVAGAIQDHGRGLIIGGRTFGKGSVQSVMNLDGLGQVSLTTSMYYTPSGRSIQAEGIVPDIQLYYHTDSGDVDRPFSEMDLEGFLHDDAAIERKPAARVDVEKLHWYYRNAGRVPEEPGPKDMDALMALAFDLLTSSVKPTIQSMLSASSGILAEADKVVVPKEEGGEE